ncbi:unnamed protein product [Linum tenue]|uniref:PROP1-like PPR domain-containing protein n=1 Tax=Linum tenue TaxID=586396 RepID=A0AAV0GV71_9ROSI|nr:unnamed protein product [Linum tenue]
MELGVSAASQSLTLLSCTQLPSTLSSTNAIRREFLGCGHNLRPPGGLLRSREAKCRKVRIRKGRPPRRFVMATNSVMLVVAVTTVSAVSVFYLNRYLKTKKTQGKESSDEELASLNSLLTHLSSSIMSHVSGSRNLRIGDAQNGVSQAQSEDVMVKEDERISISVTTDRHVQVQEMHYGSGLAETVESPAAVFASSTALDYADSKESETALLSPSSPSVTAALPLVFDRETSGFVPENPREEGDTSVHKSANGQVQGTHNGSVITEMKESWAADFQASTALNNVAHKDSEAVELSSPPSVVSLPEAGDVRSFIFVEETVDSPLEKNGHIPQLKSDSADEVASAESSSISLTRDVESGELADINSYSDSIEESIREGLHTFFQSKESVVKSDAKKVGFKAMYSSSSLQSRTLFSSLKVNSARKGAEVSTQTSCQTPENLNGKVHQDNVEGDSVEKSTRTGSIKANNKGSGRLKHENRGKPSKLPTPNGFHANENNKPPEQFNAYNYLLKDGRLVECVDFLEDMDSKGFLDMNKVYHAKFFDMCKRQKAVKEAFRFCKLIPNPTLSTFNMLMSVCTSSQDSDGAFQVLRLAEGARLQPDCKLYTTLISTCAKCGKVDAMFEVFHEMVNAGVEPNLHTYGALIDGCARAGQVAKAFGAYGIMRSKNLKPDRVVFNALITACGQSGAVDRAFDVLSEMKAEIQPIDPDHVTVGALIKACANAGQVDRAKEVYNMLDKYKIKGTPEVYTIAINCCSETGDWDFAHRVCEDMLRKGVLPDEMFLSALIDVAGHAGKVDVAFEILQEARKQGSKLGVLPYSSLMGACSNAKNWHKALLLYDDMKAFKLKPTVPTMNALITALCDGGELQKAIEMLAEMKSFGLKPNTITYCVLLVASERNDDLEAGLMLLSEAKRDNVTPTLLMYKCVIGLCVRRYEKACILGEPILSNTRQPQIVNQWTTHALRVYREMIIAGEQPTMDVVSQILGCLRLPSDPSVKDRLVENLDVTADDSTRHSSNLCSLVDGYGEYDPRAFSIIEEAASFGIVPCLSYKQSPVMVDAKRMDTRIAEVYIMTVFRGLKHRLAAGAKLPNVTIILPTEQAKIAIPKQEKTINLAGRVAQSVASLLRRLGVSYQGNESYGKIRINGITLRRWFQPKLASPAFTGKPNEFEPNLTGLSFQSRIGKGISHQQRDIRTGNLSLD